MSAAVQEISNVQLTTSTRMNSEGKFSRNQFWLSSKQDRKNDAEKKGDGGACAGATAFSTLSAQPHAQSEENMANCGHERTILAALANEIDESHDIVQPDAVGWWGCGATAAYVRRARFIGEAALQAHSS